MHEEVRHLAGAKTSGTTSVTPPATIFAIDEVDSESFSEVPAWRGMSPITEVRQGIRVSERRMRRVERGFRC